MSEDVEKTFDYDVLDPQTRAFVLQKTMETHGLLKRTAEHIVQIGQNLLSIKASLGHGYFEAWLQAEFAMSKRQARRFILVAERFGGKSAIISDLPVTVIYELAAPSTSEAIIERVESKQISATLDAIKTAKEAERQVRAEQAALQEQLAREREAAAAQIHQLSLELECAQQQLTQLSVSLTAKIKEVPVVPSEVTAQLDAFQRQQVWTLQAQLAQLALQLQEQRDLRLERRITLLETLVEQRRGQTVDRAGPQTRAEEDVQPDASQSHGRRLNPAELRARSRLIPLIEYGAGGSYVVICPQEGELHLTPDSPEWFEWVASLSSFRFVGQQGRFTAYRDSTHGRPTRSWRAHRCIHQQHYKHSLGVTDQLSITRLEQVAAILQSHMASVS